MRQVTVHTVISAPRERVFDFVADLSLRPAYCDHYLQDYRLSRANPRGLGAAARFRLDAPLADEWAEIEIKACDRPRRIVEEGRVGRLGRSRLVAVYDFVAEASNQTRVELTTYSEPSTLVDRLKEIGAGAWMRRQSRKSLLRLRDIFEEGPGDDPLPRTTVAGYDPGKAPRFGDHILRTAAAGQAPAGGSGGGGPPVLIQVDCPPPMALRKHTLAACALSLALAGGLAACGPEHEAVGVEEPAREGLAVDVGGIEYNVFLTRQLNLEITPDEGYYDGPPAEPGNALYGVFVQACNTGEADEDSVDESVVPASEFTVVDSQGTEFEPVELPDDNAFAYHSRPLEPGDCIPADGSVAQFGPTAGAMLLYDFPLESTENRPLELEITSPDGETKHFELDL